MRILDLGLIEYEAALRRQEEAAAELAEGGSESLFLLEHPPVITFGRNGGEENLPYGRGFFEQKGVQIAQSSRGGNITCHFPGQLVAYPVMRIDRRPGGLRRFFSDMEASVIRTLAHFGLNSGRIEGKAGVWIGDKKICSTGIAVKRWITMHGLSLNVGRDISLFEMVRPCGLAGVAATSLHRELDADLPSMMEVKEVFCRCFCEVFQTKGPSPLINAAV